MVSHAEVEGPRMLLRHNSLAYAMVAKENGTNGRGSTPRDITIAGEERKNGRVERALAPGQAWVLILVPSWMTYVPSSIWYRLCACFSTYTNEDQTAYFARLQ